MRMQLKVSNIHQKSIKLHFFNLVAVVLANGWLLLTTGHYLLKFCIIANEDAINSFKYSPKINKTNFFHSDCCSTCQWLAFTLTLFETINYLLIRYNAKSQQIMTRSK